MRKYSKRKLEVLEACWKAVEHWYENWVDPKNASSRAEDCPLCQLFAKGDCNDMCTVNRRDCPVKRTSGEDLCEKTPYYRAYKSIFSLQYRNTKVEEARQFIQKEYAFLVQVAFDEANRS